MKKIIIIIMLFFITFNFVLSQDELSKEETELINNISYMSRFSEYNSKTDRNLFLLCYNNKENFKNKKFVLSLLTILQSKEVAVVNFNFFEKFIPIEFFKDDDFMIKLFDNSIFSFIKLSNNKLLDDKKIIDKYIIKHTFILEHISQRLYIEYNNDISFIYNLIEQNCSGFEYLSDEVKSNRDIVMKAVNRCGHLLCCVSEEFKKDKDIVYLAIINDPTSLRYISDLLIQDDEFMSDILKLINKE